MIRNAVIHFNGRLPMLADLRSLRGPRDISVLATNVRTRDGKRPSFRRGDRVAAHAVAPPVEPVVNDQAEPDLDGMPIEPDEDLLARIRQL